MLVEAADVEAVPVLLLDVAGEVAARDSLDAVGAVDSDLKGPKDGRVEKLELRPDPMVSLVNVLPPVAVLPPTGNAGSW